MTPAVIDDGILSAIIRDQRPAGLGDRPCHTTGLWYLRLCQAQEERGVLGALSGPFGALAPDLRRRASAKVLDLPEEIGLLSLRTLAPVMAQVRSRHQVNLLAAEALAASLTLGGELVLSTTSPRLEQACRAEGVRVRSLDLRN